MFLLYNVHIYIIFYVTYMLCYTKLSIFSPFVLAAGIGSDGGTKTINIGEVHVLLVASPWQRFY